MCQCSEPWTLYEDELHFEDGSDTEFYIIIHCDKCGALMKAKCRINDYEDYDESKVKS